MTQPEWLRGQWRRRFVGRVYADRQTVFRLLADIGLWPAFIPHVRSARVVRRDGRRRLVRVRASWHGIRIGWTAVETVDEFYYWMALRHVSRLTGGSVATWSVGPEHRLEDGRTAVDVTVEQQVMVLLPFIGGWLASRFVGGVVARELGQAILDRVTWVAEGGSLAGRE